MTTIGYARVSTTERNLDLQRDALTTAGSVRTFEDLGVSGRLTSRPGLDACSRWLRRNFALRQQEDLEPHRRVTGTQIPRSSESAE